MAHDSLIHLKHLKYDKYLFTYKLVKRVENSYEHCFYWDRSRFVVRHLILFAVFSFLFHTGFPGRYHDAVYSSKLCYFLDFLWPMANSAIDWWRPLLEEGLWYRGNLWICLQKIMRAGCVKLLGFDLNLWRNILFFIGSYAISTKVRYVMCDEYILGSKN